MTGHKAASRFLDMAKGPNSLLLFCLICIFSVGAIYLLSWPISGLGDTDLWYHLNGGRYFFEQHKPADSGFFSFIANDRTWTNYYWFFQVTVYSVFALFDYHGLVVFRSFVYLLTLAAVFRFLLRDIERDDVYLYFAVLAIIFFLALMPRHITSIRPHMFSYLFIVLSLNLLESKNKYGLIALPLLAIFWCNLHGVEYPVMMLICFAYLAETFVVRIKSRTPLDRQTVLRALPILLALYAVFVTPFGINLLYSPFQSAPNQHRYIAELMRPDLPNLFSVDMATIKTIFTSLSNILLAVALLSCFKGLLTQKIKASHLILFAGSVILLFKAQRFRYEFVLLCLPIMKAYPLLPMLGKEGAISKNSRIAASLFILILSLVFIHKVFRPQPDFPLSKTKLPAGTAAFLNKVDVGGRVLNFSGHGGYLQWELHKNYTIYMDLEMMLFTDEDFFMSSNAFHDENVLAKAIEQHQPDFIAPHKSSSNFKKIIKDFSQYQLVFFDDAVVLYVDRNKHPEIATEYSLEILDPFGLHLYDIAGLAERDAGVLLTKMEKIYAVYPDGYRVNQVLVQLYRRFENLDTAMRHAEQITQKYPELPTGFQLKGDVWAARQNREAALENYKIALSLSGEKGKTEIYRKKSAIYLSNGQPAKAYRSLKKAVNIFGPSISNKDLYDLGRVALAAGDTKEGVMFLQFALLKTAEDNIKLRANIQRKLMGVMLKER